MVLPLTSKNKNHPLHILIEWEKGGSDENSYILCDQIRTVSRQRFQSSCFGVVDYDTLEKIRRVRLLLLYL